MRRLVALAAPVLALGVLWNTLTLTAAENNPDLAAKVRPGNEIIAQRQALLAFPAAAAAGVNVPATALDPALQLAQQSLARSAITPNAAGVVGFAATLQRDPAKVGRLLTAQPQIGWRDRLLLLSGMIYHAEREEPRESIAAMATLSRIQRTPDPSIFPAIISLSRYDEALPPLLDLLESAPTWRARFMVVMGEMPDNGPLFARLVDGLLDRGANLSADELAPFFIVNRTRLPLPEQWSLWQRAYGSDPAGAAAPLRNGDFERTSGPPPYSWRVGEGEGVSALLAPRSDTGEGMWLEALVDGDKEYEVTSQFLTAGPGRWTLSLGASIDSDLKEKMALAVTCLPGGAQLAGGDYSPGLALTRVSLSFTVPAQGCVQQQLRITARPNLSETPFAVRLDDARMERAR